MRVACVQSRTADLDPGHVWTHLRRTHAPFGLDWHSDALTTHDRAVELELSHAGVHADRAAATVALGKDAEAGKMR